MLRTCSLILLAAFSDSAAAEELKLRPLASGSIGEKQKPDGPSTEQLRALAPKNHVIRDAKELEKLCKAWSIDVPKVDFDKELVIVGTWLGSSFNAQGVLKDGTLSISFLGTKDLRPGFRYLLAACPSDGVKQIGR